MGRIGREGAGLTRGASDWLSWRCSGLPFRGALHLAAHRLGAAIRPEGHTIDIELIGLALHEIRRLTEACRPRRTRPSRPTSCHPAEGAPS